MFHNESNFVGKAPCLPSMEDRIKKERASADAFQNALDALEKLPYFDRDYSAAYSFVGALYAAKRSAEATVERLMKDQEKA